MADDAVDFVLAQQRFFRANAVLSLNDDPERAARAAELAEATGADPSIVYGDLDSWEAQHKAGLTNEIISANPKLRDYANSAPLNAKVSNDDWGALDSVSNGLKAFAGSPTWTSFIYSAKKFAEGAEAGFDAPGLAAEAEELVNYIDNPVWKVFASTNLALYAPDLAARTFNAAVTGVSAMVGQAATDLTGSEAQGRRLARDFNQFVQVGLSGQGGFHLAPELQAAARLGRKVGPYVEAGKEPPAGLDPLIDQAKAKQSAEDLAGLEEAEKLAQGSATRERAPDAFADFIRQHTDAKIGVNADMVRALYGDKVPAPDDGLLGFVPDLARKLEIAEATGGDVEIALADWLAKVEPEVSKALKDGVRVREDGVSAVEAAEAVAKPEGFEAYHGSPHEFDVFDISKIGTGEGAQSYGHGLYFAEEKAVGEEYKRTLSAGEFGAGLAKDAELSQRLDKAEKEYQDAQTEVKRLIREKAAIGIWDAEKKQDVAFRRYQAVRDEAYKKYPGGQLYRVRIKARPEQFLDWDRPVQEQPEIWNAIVNHELMGDLKTSDIPNWPNSTGADVYFALGEMLKSLPKEELNKMSMQQYGQALDSANKAVSDAMAEAGIPGIRFLDQGSRKPPTPEQIERQRQHVRDLEAAAPAGEGPSYVKESLEEAKRILEDMQRPLTRNYVLFTDKIIEVLDRNGEAVQSVREAARLDPVIPQPAVAESAAEPQAASPFPTKPGWMSAEQYARYLRLIDQRNLEDAAASAKRVEKEIRRRQSAEWKQQLNEIRKEIAAGLDQRPEMQADTFFREGRIGSAKLETGIPKLGREFLSAEQIADLPERYTREGGLDPNDVAQLFGYPDGEALLADLSRITQERENSGKNYAAWRRGVIERETAAEMERRHGQLEANILEEAKEHVLSDTQMDLLHEDVLAMGLAAGAKFPITRAEFEGWVKGKFDATLTGEVKSDRFLRDAGTAGRRVEDALLKGDIAEAFRQRQRQYIAVLLAREAQAFEKDVAKVEKLAKRFAKTEVKAVAPEYTAATQLLLRQAGYKGKLSVSEIAEGLAFHGYDSIDAFVERSLSDGWEPEVADWLKGGAKPAEQMTTAEFREFKDAITSFNHIGRKIQKIEIGEAQKEFGEFRQEVLDHITKLPVRSRESQGRWLYEADASLTRMEEIIKDLDLREELGPLYRAVIVPMMLSKAKEFDLVSALAKHFKETRGEFGKKWQRTLSDSIPQDFIIDPYTRMPYDLTRENLIQIMLNWGNRSNIEKFTLGHAALYHGGKVSKEVASQFEAQVKALIDTHATAEDWAFVQRMWQPFREWQPMSDTVSRNVSGVVPKWVQPEAVPTPHGVQEGGYWPVKYDRLGSNMAVIEDRQDSNALFGPGYFRAATAKSHLKERTGYIDFVDISTSLEQAAGTMQQTMHDIAFRDSLVQANRVLNDKQIRAAIRKHYGAEYEAQLMPWLKRIANKNTADDRAIKWYNDWQRRVRVNMIGHVLPLNLRVILSPDIGVPDPVAWASFESNRSANKALAMEKSQEIRHLVYNMDRDFREQLERATTKSGFTSFQAKAVEWGFAPMMRMSQEFRMSTFVDQYRKALARGLSDFDAITVADSFVRERHGAASVVDLPAIMQGSETMKSLTMFYGYFNSMYNWQRQLPGNARRGEWNKFAVNGLGSVVVGAAFGAALFNQAKEGDGWFKTVAKALALQPLSTVPIVRDAANYLFEGQQPRTPTVALFNALAALYTDVKRKVEHKPMKKPIQNTANVIGFGTGLPLAQIGRTAEFLNDVRTGQQRPRNIFEWGRGIISGEARLHK